MAPHRTAATGRERLSSAGNEDDGESRRVREVANMSRELKPKDTRQTPEKNSVRKQSAESENSVVVINWPTDTSTQKYWWTAIAIAFLLVLCLWSVFRETDLIAADLYVIVGCTLLMVVLVFGYPYFAIRRILRARRRARAVLAGDVERLSAADILISVFTIEGIEPDPLSGTEPEFRIIAGAFEKLELEFPRVVIDQRIAGDTEAIDRPSELLEPEPVTSGQHTRRYVWAILRTAIALFVITMWWEESIILVIVCSLVALQGIWAIVSLFLFARSPANVGIIAGPGYIEGEGGGYAIAAQCITLISKVR